MPYPSPSRRVASSAGGPIYPGLWNDAKLGQECESLIALKTHFTGEPPYVGNEGVLLALREALDDLKRLRVASSARGPITRHPEAGRLNQAYTPHIYEGHLESAPPPYINISEAKTPYEEAIITVRSPRKADGSTGDSAFIVMTKSDLRALFLRAARYWGWLPMTEEQWQRDYYIANPDEAKKARERIEQLRLQRDEAQRVVEETTSTLAGSK
jgi:hypothetical protein